MSAGLGWVELEALSLELDLRHGMDAGGDGDTAREGEGRHFVLYWHWTVCNPRRRAGRGRTGGSMWWAAALSSARHLDGDVVGMRGYAWV
jgi:hypothetical protein